ncbi:nicotinate-nucleotide adenylyltransferase [Deferribacter thermophilus]|uniref:nicotinate-nucleotide adenylyltransferase n=1 Tax=Deferribacter thermophilus TaxID=53573 RepID=UPI003C1EAEEF
MRIVLFGGTFNPIHNGHLELAKRVYKDFNVDKFYFIPAKIPPHKNLGLVEPEKRFEMVKLALTCCLKGNFYVSDYELKSDEISYTFNTLRYFRKKYKDDYLYFLTGSDIFATIETWQNWDKLFDLANFIVANRKEMPFNTMLKKIPDELKKRIVYFPKFDDKKYGNIILYEIEEIPISSTEIREKFLDGSIFNYLPDVVINYIKENKLYQEV